MIVEAKDQTMTNFESFKAEDIEAEDPYIKNEDCHSSPGWKISWESCACVLDAQSLMDYDDYEGR